MKDVYDDGFEHINAVQCWAAFVHGSNLRYASPKDNPYSGGSRKATEKAQSLGVSYGQK
jgi:hypothetical protein